MSRVTISRCYGPRVDCQHSGREAFFISIDNDDELEFQREDVGEIIEALEELRRNGYRVQI